MRSVAGSAVNAQETYGAGGAAMFAHKNVIDNAITRIGRTGAEGCRDSRTLALPELSPSKKPEEWLKLKRSER